MSTPNHDTELEEILNYGLWNEAFNTAAEYGTSKYGKRKEAALLKAEAALHTYLYKQTLEDIGFMPLESELHRYNNELRGKYEERHRLRKAAAERWNQTKENV